MSICVIFFVFDSSESSNHSSPSKNKNDNDSTSLNSDSIVSLRKDANDENKDFTSSQSTCEGLEFNKLIVGGDIHLRNPTSSSKNEKKSFSNIITDKEKEKTNNNTNAISKYEKMIKVGIPLGSIAHEMKQEGVTDNGVVNFQLKISKIFFLYSSRNIILGRRFTFSMIGFF